MCVLTDTLFLRNSFTGTCQTHLKVPDTGMASLPFHPGTGMLLKKAQIHWNNQIYANTGKAVQPAGAREAFRQFAASLLAMRTQSLLLSGLASLSPYSRVSGQGGQSPPILCYNLQVF